MVFQKIHFNIFWENDIANSGWGYQYYFFLSPNLLGNHLPFMNITLITFFNNDIHKNTNQSLLLGLIRKVYRILGFWSKFAQYRNWWFQWVLHSFAPTHEIVWSFVKTWTCFLTHKQLKHLYTFIWICLTVKIYCLNGFTHRKIWFFFCYFQY